MSDRTVLAAGSEWFEIREVGRGVWLISEPGHVNSFLITGDDAAVLFDAGLNIAPMSAAVRQLTSLPVTLVVSHHHYDHRGGAAELLASGVVHEFAAHPARQGYYGDVDAGFLASYAAVMRHVLAQHDHYRALDDSLFFALPDLPRMRPMPDLAAWRMPAATPTRWIEDGDTIDLGGRRLAVLHTPGHSPDSICLWDDATGQLFSGDTVLAAATWLHLAESDLADFARSTARLTTLPAREVLVAHNLHYRQPPDRIARVAGAAQAVIEGRTSPVVAPNMVGGLAEHHVFCGATLLLPCADALHDQIPTPTTGDAS